MAVVGVIGRDTVDRGLAAQAIGPVLERAGHAAFGAAYHSVLAVPGHGSAARIGQGVAVGVAGHSRRRAAVLRRTREAVGGVMKVIELFVCFFYVFLSEDVPDL